MRKIFDKVNLTMDFTQPIMKLEKAIDYTTKNQKLREDLKHNLPEKFWLLTDEVMAIL